MVFGGKECDIEVAGPNFDIRFTIERTVDLEPIEILKCTIKICDMWWI